MPLKLCLLLISLVLSVINSRDISKQKNVLTHLKTDYVKKFKKHFFDDVVFSHDEGERKDTPSRYLNQNANSVLNLIDKLKELDNKLESAKGAGGYVVKRREGDDNEKKDPPKKKENTEDLSSTQESSSQEKKTWQTQWEEYWLKKKFDVLNTTRPKGEVLNMVGARPWGVACGDPNQHDMPWGTCMLAMECEPDLRIYRGDYICGRTEFACCGFQLTTYDLDQANDEISMESKGMSQDVEENAANKKKDREKKKKNHDVKRKRRKLDQAKRKKKIRQKIKEIIREINKMMDKMFKNQTKTKSKKTKDLKKFLKQLKKQYKADRVAMLDIHNELSLKMDAAMMLKLNQVRDMNENFVQNATFRDILVNGTVNNRQARMLVEAYPEMYRYIPHRLRSKDMLKKSRRSGGKGKHQVKSNDYPYEDYLDYDIEYGYLYY